MTKIQYRLNNFDSEQARNGALCALVPVRYSDGSDIWSIVNNVPNPDLKGAGTCEVTASATFRFFADSKLYSIDKNGNCINDSTVKLMLATIVDSKVKYVGSVVPSTARARATRSMAGADGIGNSEISYESERNIYIDSLNARDQFATDILKGIMAHMEKDPTSVSEHIMQQYCESAYKWASFMLYSAANSRGEVIDNTETKITKKVAVGELENNQEKLFNNIIYSMEKTDFEEDGKDKEGNPIKIYSERIINPVLNTLIRKYLRSSKTPEGAEEKDYILWNYEDFLNRMERIQYSELNKVGEEEYSQRIINPKLNDLTEAFLKHSSSGEGDIKEYAAFEDLTTLIENLQHEIENAKYQRVEIYKLDDRLNSLLSKFDSFLTKLDTQNQNLVNINTSIQTFTTAMDARLAAIEEGIGGLSSQISSAESNILAAMPQCKYTPPAENSEPEGTNEE